MNMKATHSFQRPGTSYPAMKYHIPEGQNPQQSFKFMHAEQFPLRYYHVALQKFAIADICKMPNVANMT
jgi:hypothetical protein